MRRNKKPRSSPAPAGLNPTDELKLWPTEAEGRRARALAVSGTAFFISAHYDYKCLFQDSDL